MREIKFRAWDNFGSEWAKPDKLDNLIVNYSTLGDGIFELQDDSYSDRGHGDFTIEQFTGLYDRHGKEIYEGDIIEWIDAPGMVDTFGVVEFITRRGAWYVVNDEENIYDDIYNVFDDSRIVGNIHEDGDLL